MAAGAGGAAGGSFESTVDRKFLSVTNTMDSIQGLSTWCIDNKKYHSLVVRRWIKCLKKSDASHKLNLFYLANDVIQNCKRKNAIVYRTAFADVLPEAFSQINNDGDAKVIKSVERILTIWEDRSVYSGALITELRNSLVKEESPPETPVEQKTPVESKADIQSKIVAEFVPQALIDQLSKYKRSLEEVDLREKQLAAMRVDIFSSEALKKLKDKAGGKKFSRDFEEGSAQLQEFVKFFDRQSKVGPPLLEALSNADIFYEMQYKEVKIVANAYQTFANRVSHLKRKLDNLKSTLPDLDESPIPSPSADAPSPTGSESPFHGLSMASPDPDIDGSALDDDAERPAPSPLSSPGGSPKITENLGENDNREVEDMELSDEETVSGGIIEEKVECPAQPKLSVPVPAKVEPLVPMEKAPPRVTTPAAAPAGSTEAVDLAKIGSILNSLSSVIKTTDSPSALDTIPTPTMEDANSLVNLLSQVDMSPADLLSALSKVQGPGGLEGISSLLSSPATDSSSTGKSLPPPSSTSVSAAPSQSSSLSSAAHGLLASTSATQRSSSMRSRRPPQTNPAPTPAPAPAPAPAQNLHLNKDSQPEPANPESLESKIHNFLHGNPAFSNFDLGFSANSSHGGENLSPVTGTDAQDGTPVRDEGGGTPTLDEIMDKPANPSSVGESVNAAHIPYQSSTQQNLDNAQQPPHSRPGAAQNGQLYQPYKYGTQEMPNHAITTPAAHYQPMSAQSGGSASGEGAPGGASSAQTHEGFHGVSERGWYGDSYPEGGFQQPPGYNVTRPVVTGDKQSSGHYPFQANQTQEAQELQGASSSAGFFSNFLPPVPKLPPPPNVFNIATTPMIPAEQKQPAPSTGELSKSRGDSIISGMVVHDHEHKSLFRPEDPPYDLDKRRRHPEDHERYHEGPHRQDPQFFPDAPFSHPDEAYPPPGSPPSHYPRGRAPPHSPSEEGYYAHDYQRHSPPHPHFAPRRPPPHPRLEMRFPGMRPPHRPIHPAHHPHPRGPPGPPRPPFPPFHGPDPRLRGKRPGPRGGMNLGPMFPPKRPFPPPRF